MNRHRRLPFANGCKSHLIPIHELANGVYEGLCESEKNEKLKADFEAFLRARPDLVLRAAKQLAEGRQVSAGEVFGE